MHENQLSRCPKLQDCALWQLLVATRDLAAPIAVGEILQKSIASALQVLDAERGSVFLYDAGTNELYTKVSTGDNQEGPAHQGNGSDTWPTAAAEVTHDLRFSADQGIAGETARERRLINVADCYANPHFNREIDHQTGYITRSMLSVPLLGINDVLMGVLQVLNSRSGSFDEDDEQIAQTLAAHCAVALQRAMLLEEYIVKQRMERDLALAREIQMGALPRDLPDLADYEIAALSQPAEKTGGDIYDAIALGERRIALLMADATGHGIGPALSVSQMQAMFRMGLLLGCELGEVMPRINTQLKKSLPPGRFVTAFGGILDGREHRIHYHSWGQAPLLHYSAGLDEIVWLSASTVPMGILARAPMDAPDPLEMRPGDVFALISDGFFEYANPAGEQFGRERIGEWIHAHRRLPLDQMVAHLREAIHVFAAGAPQEDDMTILLVRRAGA